MSAILEELEEDTYEILSAFEDKYLEAKDIVEKEERKLKKVEKIFLEHVNRVKEQNIRITMLRNQLIDNLVPKIKHTFTKLNTDIDLEGIDIIKSEEKLYPLTHIEDKPSEPFLTRGVFFGILMGTFISLAILGSIVINIANSMKIVIPIDKMMNQADAVRIMEYIGLGFTGKQGDLLIGMGLLSISFLIIMGGFVVLNSFFAKRRSLNKAKKFKKDVELFIHSLVEKEQELEIIEKEFDFLEKELEIFNVIIEEEIAKINRIIIVEHVKNHDDVRVKDLLLELSKLALGLRKLLIIQILDNGKLNLEFKNTLIEEAGFLNNYLSNVYGEKRIFIRPN